MMKKNYKITIIGLGYVGLPLAIEFAKKYPTIGYDINFNRINELNNGTDNTLEVKSEKLKSVLVKKIDELKKGNGFFVTNNLNHINDSNIYIITVPTPIDKDQSPLLTPLFKATKTVGNVLSKGDIVIYESTVYPGLTEEECVPILELSSKLKLNKDFFVGYSPERINPGDKDRTITKIIKITSGSNTESAKEIDGLYKSIITAGTYLAPSIKVAEAAKVIENSQRDVNIAFVNELSKIFNLMDIDTSAVLKAAGTKWNFLNFKPGLVGGHCIGVDPYYLAKKSMDVGYDPKIILTGREVNDSMGKYVSENVIELMERKGINIYASKILVLGIAFKENCPDIRNSKVVDIIYELDNKGADILVYDPWVDSNEVKSKLDIDITKNLSKKKFDVIILAVAHNEFLSLDIKKIKNKISVVFDVKGVLDKSLVDATL